MPENDLRQTIMLHERDLEGVDVDAWHLADYGDGWGCYAVTQNDLVLLRMASPRVERNVSRARARRR